MTCGTHYDESNPRTLRLVAPASLLAGALGLGASPALAADRPAICDTSFDPYTASPATRDACGIKSFSLREKTTNPDGSKEYLYEVGVNTVDWVVPPPGFDPSTALPAELARFGIPEPPVADAARHSEWEYMIHHVRHFATPPDALLEVPVKAPAAMPVNAAAPLPVNAPASLTVDPSAGGATAAITANWSGLVTSLPGRNLTSVDGAYVEPSPQPTSCPGNSAVFWDGIGGFNSGYLAQDGTAINTPTLAQHQAWWEILPDQPYIVALNLYGTPGYTFIAQLFWNGPSNGYAFQLYDYGSATMASFQVSSTSYDGSTTEFIAERPEVNGAFVPLTGYGTARWTHAISDNNYSYRMAQEPVTMKNGGDVLAIYVAPSGTSGGFTDNWKNCQ